MYIFPFADVYAKPPDDLVVVYPICLFLLLDELIEKVLLGAGRMLISAIDASDGALNAHSYHGPKRWRTNAMDRVLVEEEV